MGQYSVPESIRKFKPKGTMVKKISGYYYVYEYSNFTDENGKRHTKMGKSIGSIKEGIGFIPNDTFNCDSEISTLDFGEYAITISNSKDTYKLLKDFFNPQDAAAIYLTALIHFIQGFTYAKDLKDYYDMSILSVQFPTVKLGYDAVSKLYDSLGRRQSNVIKFEENLIAKSSRQIAIDGHVIGCESKQNDLAEKGYKFKKLGESQVNLLMAYDVNTHMPLMSRIYEGASNDKISVKDFVDQVELKNMLFIIDRGFYSTENINIFSSNGNEYIIPLGKNLNTCKKAVHSLEMHDRFIYQKGRTSTVVEYKDEIIDGYRVITYRDLNESATGQANYLRNIKQGNKSYTKEGFEKAKYFMGVVVIQTSLETETPEKIYSLFKSRWSIETYYNYFKNKAGYSALHEEDYYKTQGLSFIMLVSSLIHHDMEKAVKATKGKSISDCLLEAKMVKANKRHGQWVVCNCLKKQKELFEALNTAMQVNA
jgi:transposase